MKKNTSLSKKTLLSSLSVLSLPFLTLAQTLDCTGIAGLDGLFCKISRTINSIIPILVSLAVLVFIFGILKFISGKDPEAKKQAGSYMVWGIVAIFVMVSVWGFVSILGTSIFGSSYGTAGSATTAPPVITTVPLPR